jgi:hypothetical protein
MIASYDEELIIEDRVEQIKAEWDEFHPDEPMPDDDEIREKHIGEWFFQDEWDFFVDDLEYQLIERNPLGCWESPEFEGKECFKKQIELIDKLIDFESYRYGLQKLDIYEYGRKGIFVDAEWKSSRIALPECEEGFHRDWDRDGICVKNFEEDEW